MNRVQVPALALMVSTLVAACAGPGPSPASQANGSLDEKPRVKRVTAAIKSDPPVLIRSMTPLGIGLAGHSEMAELVAVGLAGGDGVGGLTPVLAMAIPTVENRLWKILPGGRMETTWEIRDGAMWHDLQPVMAADILFTMRVEQDRDLPLSRNIAYDYIEGIDAVDDRTVVVTWGRPYIEADAFFTSVPFPRHLLQKPYLEDKTNLPHLPYWTHSYVGTGPFRLSEWAGGSHAVFDAFDSYVLGRPKIDQIEVKFIPDSTTLVANLLAGSVEVTIGRNLSLDQAVQMGAQWRAGKAEVSHKNWIMIYPQFVNPSPPIVADVRFRRALMHAMDREQMADNLVYGMTRAAHSLLNPGQPEYAEIERQVPRYEYDARQASRIVETLGYAQGSDGMFRDVHNEKLMVQIRTTQGDDLQEKAMFASADSWQRIGVGVEVAVVPIALSADREYRATFPAFDLKRQPNDISSFRRMRIAATPLSENNFVGSNYSRYMNPEFEALIDKYFVTIPMRERIEVVGQIVLHVATFLNLMGLFYQAEPAMISNRLVNVRVGDGAKVYMGNAHEWDVK